MKKTCKIRKKVLDFIGRAIDFTDGKVISLAKPVLLNAKQVQRFLGISRKECGRLLNSPGCPFSVRLGKTVYANRRALMKWNDERREEYFKKRIGEGMNH